MAWRVCTKCEKKYNFLKPRPLPGKCGDCAALEMGIVLGRLEANMNLVSEQLHSLEQLILLNAPRQGICLSIYARRAGMLDDYFGEMKHVREQLG